MTNHTKPAFRQIEAEHGNTYAARLERTTGEAFFVGADGKTVVLEAPWAMDPIFMSNAEAAALGRELLRAAGVPDHSSALLDALRDIVENGISSSALARGRAAIAAATAAG